MNGLLLLLVLGAASSTVAQLNPSCTATGCADCVNTKSSFDQSHDCAWCGDSKSGSCLADGPFDQPQCDDACLQKIVFLDDKAADICLASCEGRTCSECLSSGGTRCGWCGLTQTCGNLKDNVAPTLSGKMCIDGQGLTCSTQPGTNYRGDCLQYTESHAACPAVNCSTSATCATCAKQQGCGWCAATQVASPTSPQTLPKLSGRAF